MSLGAMRGHESSQLERRGGLCGLSSAVPRTVRRVVARHIRLYTRSLAGGSPGLLLKCQLVQANQL